MVKIVSWNVNGLRAVHRKGNWPDVWALSPDILCLQETKAQPEQLPEEARDVPGFYSYFNHPTNGKKGYSGVAVYAREEPETVEYKMGDEHLDAEGRLVTVHFKDFVLCNVYFPNGGMGPERLKFKLDFYDTFLEYIERLRCETGKPLVFCGDVNTAHEEIDLARPKANEENTGFLPEERAWIDEVMAHGYTDTFRHFNPHKRDAYSYWDMKTRARDRNVGWRLDYIFASNDVLPRVKNAEINTDIYGSDHCPVSATLR